MKTINIGILAHADAGKTTITENLLYKSGVIKNLGRVDKGNTITDSMSLEKEKGITIKTSTVSFNWNNTKINLLDTPGHVDFIAEVERSMQILDGAILVISAKEGVQVQARVIFNTLKRLKIPTIIFVNKIDRMGVSLTNVYKEIKEELTENAIKLQCIHGEGTRDINIKNWNEDKILFEEIIESICEADENILCKYINGEEILESDLKNTLIETAHNCRIYPVFHGSALQGIGINQLLQGIEKYFPDNSKNYNDDLSAVVYKIDRDKNFQKKIYIRMFQGELSIRETIKVMNKDYEVKIRKLESVSEGRIIDVNKIKAGDIGILSNIEWMRIGDIIGISPKNLRKIEMATPTLETTVLLKEPSQRMELIKALNILMEEDPFLDCKINSKTKEITVHLFGDVQMEVIKRVIKERFSIDIGFAETMTLYKETPKNVAEASIGIGEHFNPFRASIKLCVEPAPIGSGLIYESEVSYGYLTKPFQKAVFEGIKSALKQGVFEREITDLKVCFKSACYDSVTSTPSDFRDLAPLVLFEAISKAETEILEPMMSYELIIPQEAGGKAMADLAQMRATFSEPYIKGNEMIIHGKIPVETSKVYSVSLADYTSGRGVFNCNFCGYELYSGEVDVKGKTLGELDNRIKYLLQKVNAIRE